RPTPPKGPPSGDGQSYSSGLLSFPYPPSRPRPGLPGRALPEAVPLWRAHVGGQVGQPPSRTYIEIPRNGDPRSVVNSRALPPNQPRGTSYGELSQGLPSGPRRQGHTPVTSSSRAKLNTVRMTTMAPSTPTLVKVGEDATVLMMSPATRNSRPR